jgi:hypothetical protein
MVAVTTTEQAAIFEVLGWHKFLAMKSRIVVPLSHIREVRADPDVKLGWWQGWRIPGTLIPGVIVAGTYYRNRHRIFWDVVHPKHAIVVDLITHRYDKLIVEVADPGAVVERLNAAIKPS